MPRYGAALLVWCLCLVCVRHSAGHDVFGQCARWQPRMVRGGCAWKGYPMGMDLFAFNDGVEPYHANWSGWSALGDLLQELGCDVSLMAGSNDGDVVPADVALSWAEAIESNLGRIRVVVYPDGSFFGGERAEFRVEGSLTPVILSSTETARAFVAQALGRDVAASSGDLDVPPVQFDLTDRPEDEQWVVGFAQFCRSSGGFEQF